MDPQAHAQEQAGSAQERSPRVADVVGVARLPPPMMTVALDRFRAGLARLHRGVAPPPVRLLEAALAGLDPMVLSAIVSLDLPDLLGRRPTPMAQLAAQTGVDEPVLERIVDYAAVRGWVRVDRRGRVGATRVTRFLRRDHPGGWRAWVELMAAPEVHAAMDQFAAAPGGDAFAVANGAAFFPWMQRHPDRHLVFDRAMTAGGFLHGHALADTIDWHASHNVCDIGGGTGATLAVLLDRHPHLHGVVVELPAVIAHARSHPRLTVVAGDMFDELPAGCDTYLLVNVIHDWDDTSAVALLRTVRRAAAGPARVIVVESARPPRPRDTFALRSDLLMLALAPGGRERHGAEIVELAHQAGLQVSDERRLPSGDVAYELTIGS